MSGLTFSPKTSDKCWAACEFVAGRSDSEVAMVLVV